MAEQKLVALYHTVRPDETFLDAARHLGILTFQAEQRHPGQPRALYLDIEGHRNSVGGFDPDMFELQTEFIIGHLSPYLTEIHMPLGDIKRQDAQRNDVPAEWVFVASPSESDGAPEGRAN